MLARCAWLHLPWKGFEDTNICGTEAKNEDDDDDMKPRNFMSAKSLTIKPWLLNHLHLIFSSLLGTLAWQELSRSLNQSCQLQEAPENPWEVDSVLSHTCVDSPGSASTATLHFLCAIKYPDTLICKLQPQWITSPKPLMDKWSWNIGRNLHYHQAGASVHVDTEYEHLARLIGRAVARI